MSVLSQNDEKMDNTHVRSHNVDIIRQILPRPSHVPRLPAQPSLSAHLPRDPHHIIRKDAQTLRHPVRRLLQLQDLAMHLHLYVLSQISPATALVPPQSTAFGSWGSSP
jgi:hypothetical protein